MSSTDLAREPAHKPQQTTVRIAAVQYLLRAISDWDGFENQVRFVMKAAGDYKPQFVMFPEIFTTQLLSFMDTSDLRSAVREMDSYTGRYVALFTELAAHWGVHIIGGSHPTITNGRLLNTAYLFTPGGKVFTQDKIHLTRWEKEKWKGDPGNELKVFETPYGRISILICYDIEFPELSRKVCEQGADIIFVPSCTDDRQGFWRVRYCCHARAIENQVYVAVTGTVGNLAVEGLGLHFGQAAIITPSDFPFARDGIAAEGVPNMEQIVIADVDLGKLVSNRVNGTTIPLYDKRVDVYANDVEIVSTV
ncbi:MAG: carbon-nitrogen hydrolase family protein [Polaromonas sp.]|uniref:carbon-nitrogen hydrolase family protein n=1 Tax=Polaromonas sp. TaxID=1869339 RepID=UPI0024885579|nr:carbon-nitrogen hydrolase family protein [Polaromonas sp.]MDI1268138.1 carbon-nitrogen hydrolase family protein [Polaromonas sp.]MDO9115068.1 carbon-nitrogen hydrolase family protein [Polaromonas sp.]MDP1884859.1 carbon-nitrogen hydrolase family protein [Polaromonas sp.]MDP2449395.1 carbon-nitrogen hydrolase family protein [Polaromonas sp.]MDP3249741.1 carbon-nitrogen hydrolase family protein [Polaromonas sp.]